MAERYLLDTCVWRDCLESRKGKRGRPLGRYAASFLMKIIREKYTVVFPEAVFKELRKKYTGDEIEGFMRFLECCTKLIFSRPSKQESSEARILANTRTIPFNDCLLAVQARNFSAVFVTQDKHVLEDLSDIAETAKPEELI